MRSDGETTAARLHNILTRHGVQLSLHSILRSREQLGWIFQGYVYCQLIQDAIKLKRLDWAKTHVSDKFEDVIWSDEASVQLETLRKHCYRKQEECPTPKPHPKHPIKVHVWAGISSQGATKLHFSRKHGC